MRPGLLISVRSAEEAKAALAGGADLIDVKEPSRGPLGAADFEVIEQVVVAVEDRTPVSAALGEWSDWSQTAIPRGIAFAKWGLSRSHLSVAAAIREFEAVSPVLVAYADQIRAGCPPLEELVDAACDLRFPVFLIDTAIKDGAGLLEWTTMKQLERARRQTSRAQVRFALAGSIDISAIQKLAHIAPDWFAVRGAACDGGRQGAVSTNRVKQLKSIIGTARTTTAVS